MKVTRAQWTRIRLTLIFGVFVLAWGMILWRALELQVLERDKLAQIAEDQCYRDIKIKSIRGEIYDRRGEKLASSLQAHSIFAQPRKIENPRVVSSKLAKALGLKRRDVLKKLKSKKSFVWIKRQAGPEENRLVQALKIQGLGSIKESKRFYPNKEMAAHVLGFVGVDGVGLEGLEIGYDKHLNAGETLCRVKRDALGRIFVEDNENIPRKSRGANVTLTIDQRIQYITEKALVGAIKEYGAKGGMALVINPRTGEILASVVAPGFNPNAFGRYSMAYRRNRILTDTFDPGSTFKVFVVAAALEEGLITPLDKVDCENGTYKVSNHVIHDHTKSRFLTVNKIIKHSSNIGTVKIGEQLGAETMYKHLKRFSFGRRTGIDFPGESAGLLRPPKRWRKLDLANVAFGQGVSVTALQLTMAMSALANEGLLMRPYIVDRVTDNSGAVILKRRPEIIRQVVSAKTAREVNAMLRMVVTEGGTGVRAEPLGYPAAGKTGTAQKLDLVRKVYSDEKYFSSFLGFVPYENPKLTIFVALDEPWPKTYGGLVAAPVFKEIAEKVLPMLNVTPAPILDNGPTDLPSYMVESPAPVRKVSRAKKTERKKAEQKKTRIVKSEPEKKKEVSNKIRVSIDDVRRQLREEMEREDQEFGREDNTVRVAPERMIMPDLRGMSMGRVRNLMARYELDVNFKGSGQAVWQSPSAGKSIKAGQVCRVKFEQW